jgi:DNA-binding ferritin-like protein
MKQRMLKTGAVSVSQPSIFRQPSQQMVSLDDKLADCISDMLDAAPAFHRLHLKVTGPGSFAQHKALNELYDALPGLVDTVAESYQGAAETILNYPLSQSLNFQTVEEAISYIRMKYDYLTEIQNVMPYSEIVNDIDMIKTLFNATKYKLLFLK